MSNSLASMHPELVQEWSERNLPLTPDKITYGSNKLVWWKCSCRHNYKTKMDERTIAKIINEIYLILHLKKTCV